jgi:hypothetical protein
MIVTNGGLAAVSGRERMGFAEAGLEEPQLPEFHIRLSGVVVPEINIYPNADGVTQQLAARDAVIGWMTVTNDFDLEYRDTGSWMLLPLEMRRASVDKGWNRTTPQELIGILWTTGVLK